MLHRWLRRETVQAVHRRDLVTILEELGLLDDVLAGSIGCARVPTGEWRLATGGFLYVSLAVGSPETVSARCPPLCALSTPRWREGCW
jgi:hypothetical protein